MHLLAVGNAVLDIVNIVEAYPQEDDEVRATEQYLSRGGNATNTLVVLRQLAHQCDWAGVMAQDSGGRYILADLERAGIGCDGVKFIRDGQTPTSYICVSQTTASRTIVHHRNLPEYTAKYFSTLDLNGYDWIHFEGREPIELADMLAITKLAKKKISCSLEVEKDRLGIEALFSGPDLILFSKVYAQSKGFSQGGAFLDHISQHCTANHLFCAWGEQGAYGLVKGQKVQHSPAVNAGKIIDTLGAGDVFNASVIHSVHAGYDIQRVLNLACRLAGQKCAQYGLNNLLC